MEGLTPATQFSKKQEGYEKVLLERAASSIDEIEELLETKRLADAPRQGGPVPERRFQIPGQWRFRLTPRQSGERHLSAARIDRTEPGIFGEHEEHRIVTDFLVYDERGYGGGYTDSLGGFTATTFAEWETYRRDGKSKTGRATEDRSLYRNQYRFGKNRSSNQGQTSWASGLDRYVDQLEQITATIKGNASDLRRDESQG